MSFSFLSWQSRALALLCATDLATTVWLCCAHDAAEANPLMAFFLARGVFAFAAAKATLTVCPLLVLEWARTLKPRLGATALNTALLGYVMLYGVGLARVNISPSMANAEERINEDPASVAWLDAHNRRIAAKRQALWLQTSLNTPNGPDNPMKLLPAAPGASSTPMTTIYMRSTTLD